jgi:hypothetical protein
VGSESAAAKSGESVVTVTNCVTTSAAENVATDAVRGPELRVVRVHVLPDKTHHQALRSGQSDSQRVDSEGLSKEHAVAASHVYATPIQRAVRTSPLVDATRGLHATEQTPGTQPSRVPQEGSFLSRCDEAANQVTGCPFHDPLEWVGRPGFKPSGS